MLAKSHTVDNPTAGLAMKAYAKLGLREHWRSVSVFDVLIAGLVGVFIASRDGAAVARSSLSAALWGLEWIWSHCCGAWVLGVRQKRGRILMTMIARGLNFFASSFSKIKEKESLGGDTFAFSDEVGACSNVDQKVNIYFRGFSPIHVPSTNSDDHSVFLLQQRNKLSVPAPSVKVVSFQRVLWFGSVDCCSCGWCDCLLVPFSP